MHRRLKVSSDVNVEVARGVGGDLGLLLSVAITAEVPASGLARPVMECHCVLSATVY